jgi:hypothetical protein
LLQLAIIAIGQILYWEMTAYTCDAEVSFKGIPGSPTFYLQDPASYPNGSITEVGATILKKKTKAVIDEN